ncbi:MAG: diacylglycerol kinase family lipid kinase, partial [Clostridia bacterium]|nr:diacylglycerol kinase family lipid kinase [Clostridia bacterium]
MRRIAFVYNPYSGKGKIRNHFADIIDTFAKEDCEIVVVPTKAKGYCTDYIASQGKSFETICVAGGDGTVNE